MRYGLVFVIICTLLCLVLFTDRLLAADSVSEDRKVFIKKEQNQWVKIVRNRAGISVLEEVSDPRLNLAAQKQERWQAQANSGLFEPYIAYPTGSWPEATAIGDVNGDGKNDVVLTTTFYFEPDKDYKLFIFLQSPTGELAAPMIYDAGNGDSVALADLNNDGKSDVAVTADNGIGVFLQNSNGNLEPMIVYPATFDPHLVRTGDLNHDGRADIVTSAWSSGTTANNINVFLQNSGGTLNPSEVYSLKLSGFNDIEVGDISNDGLCDVAGWSGEINDIEHLGVLYQNSGGTLNPPVYYGLGQIPFTWGLAIGDVNGDLLRDVVVTYGGNSPGSHIAVFQQNLTGTLNSPIAYASYDIPEPVVIGRVNGDTRKDIVVAHGGWNALGVYLQDSNGSLLEEELYAIPYASHYSPHGITLGDINSDFKNDVVIADYNSGLVILYGTTAQKYNLNLSCEEGGTTDPGAGSYALDVGSEVTIEALPEAPSEFLGWSGDFTGTQNPITIVMDSDKTIRADFHLRYSLKLRSGNGGKTQPSEGTYIREPGKIITVEAIAKKNFRFVRWRGDISKKKNPVSIELNSNMKIRAEFVRQLALKIEASPGGTTKPAPGTYTFDKGKAAFISAIPDPHFEFSGWTGGFTGIENPVSVKVMSNSVIQANFKRKLYAPLNFSGQRIMNRSLFMVEYINHLKWQANPNNEHIVKYRIYKIEFGNNTVLDEIDSGIYSFQHHGVKETSVTVYGLTAVNSESRESEMVYFTIH